MPIMDTFSHRKRVTEGTTPDVFVFHWLPPELKVQIIHIWREAIGGQHSGRVAWKSLHDTIAREHGRFKLSTGDTYAEQCERYLLELFDVDLALDLIEASFRYIDKVVPRISHDARRRNGITVDPTDAVAELNQRFLRAGVGYRYEEGMILRVDSELVHSEIVKPALGFLSESGFEGPRDEFLRAHAQYRAGETKDAITNANNAFESTLRTICDQRGWACDRGAPVKVLLSVVRENGLLPGYLDKSFDQLLATLHSGLPQVRNSEGGHGQGAKPRETPEYVAGYALHLAAAAILFIVEAHKTMG